MKFVIIGNSAAGIGAAEAIRKIHPDAPLTIISDESESAYSRALISYELAGWLPSGSDLRLRPSDFYAQKNIQTLLGRRAVKIEATDKRVILDDGQAVPYDRLLLATGGSPKETGVPGEDKTGVFGFRTYHDLKSIHAAVKNARRAVVLGGGCIGLQAASGLHHHKVATTIAIASPHLLSQIADAECGDFFQELFEKNGLTVKTGVQPTEFQGGSRVESVLFSDGTVLPAQIVITGKGVTPNVDLAAGTLIRVDSGLIVDEHLATDEPGIYAAGDVAVTWDRVACRSTVNAIWPGAYEQGRVAGFNMAGMPRRYNGSMRLNAAEFFGVPFISMGIVKPKGEGYQTHSHMLKEKSLYRKLVFQGNLLVGAVLMGKVDGAGMLSNLMRKRVDVFSITEDLISGHYDFARVLPLMNERVELFSEPEYREMQG
jgi:nitrite reductase (NADH) large subunit